MFCGENDDAYFEVLKDIVLEEENSVGGYTRDRQCRRVSRGDDQRARQGQRVRERDGQVSRGCIAQQPEVPARRGCG